MDAIDQAIVRLLDRHGRLSQEQLAKRVRLSRPAVHQRVKRLEAAGVLKGYRAVLDWAAVGLPWPRSCRCGPAEPTAPGSGRL